MSKRSHGEGGIQKRGENSWRLRYHVGDVRHAITFRGTRKEASEKLRGLLSDADKGAHVASDKKTLAQWADEWIALKAAERQHKTVARYEDLLKKHVLPKLGERPLQQIKPIEIQKLYAELDLAPRTRHHVATVLKACLQAAVDIGNLLQTNPAATIKKPTAGDSDVGQALEQEKIIALVEGFRGSTLFDFTFLMAFTGMRRGEALALRWCDFNPAAKTLRIERAPPRQRHQAGREDPRVFNPPSRSPGITWNLGCSISGHPFTRLPKGWAMTLAFSSRSTLRGPRRATSLRPRRSA